MPAKSLFQDGVGISSLRRIARKLQNIITKHYVEYQLEVAIKCNLAFIYPQHTLQTTLQTTKRLKAVFNTDRKSVV